jgi:hypothetical protein
MVDALTLGVKRNKDKEIIRYKARSNAYDDEIRAGMFPDRSVPRAQCHMCNLRHGIGTQHING